MTEPRHIMRPLKGKPCEEKHCLLWIEADQRKTVLKATSRRLWTIGRQAEKLRVFAPQVWTDANELDALLAELSMSRQALTLWLVRGWEDMVLSGVAELIDRAVIQWRYCNLDGQKCLVRGTYRGRSLVITSLANWTGQRWAQWPHALEDRTAQAFLTGVDGVLADGQAPVEGDERLALATWGCIAEANRVLCTDRIAASVAGGSVRIWRRWLGPRVSVAKAKKSKRGKARGETMTEAVIPLPYRPDRAAEAERHASYPLFSQQLRRGFVDEPLYVVDLKSAYLIGLCATPLPARYERTLHRPSLEELADKLCERTGCAVVRIKSKDIPYPCRRGRTARYATGHFWTWLAGIELAAALCGGAAVECQTAYLWHRVHIDPQKAALALNIADAAERHSSPGIKSCWRGLYSALVGQFAGRRKVWEDAPGYPSFGRWSSWVAADCDTGAEVPYRSIAGKVQRLIDRPDTSAAVPLFYAVVTAQVRHMVWSLALLAGVENVVVWHCDSLWLTAAGWQGLQRQASRIGCAPDGLTVKAIYDRAWFSGRSVCVVEREGKRFLRAPGVGEGALLDVQGRYSSDRAAGWAQTGSFDPEKGVRRHKVTYPGQTIVKRYGRKAVAVPLAVKMDEPLLSPELLEKLTDRRTITDDSD